MLPCTLCLASEMHALDFGCVFIAVYCRHAASVGAYAWKPAGLLFMWKFIWYFYVLHVVTARSKNLIETRIFRNMKWSNSPSFIALWWVCFYVPFCFDCFATHILQWLCTSISVTKSKKIMSTARMWRAMTYTMLRSQDWRWRNVTRLAYPAFSVAVMDMWRSSDSCRDDVPWTDAGGADWGSVVADTPATCEQRENK